MREVTQATATFVLETPCRRASSMAAPMKNTITIPAMDRFFCFGRVGDACDCWLGFGSAVGSDVG